MCSILTISGLSNFETWIEWIRSFEVWSVVVEAEAGLVGVAPLFEMWQDPIAIQAWKFVWQPNAARYTQPQTTTVAK